MSRLRVCTIVRSIAASDAPLHHIVVIHQQDNPYAASLLRRKLDFTHILCSGVPYRSLRDTQIGLLLQELVDSAVELNVQRGAIEREQLIESITSTPIRWPSEQGEGEASTRSITVPATAGANMARSARAYGTIQKGKQDLVDSTSPRRGEKATTIRQCAWRLRRWSG